MINKAILSPPFSNFYFNFNNTTKIIGTYTKEKRPGRYRVFTTLKYKNKTLYNKSGLRNPGIDKLKIKNGGIVSISLLEEIDWYYISNILKNMNPDGIEFNISCPNANVQNIRRNILEESLSLTENVILKLPHGVDVDFVKSYIDIGCNFFHISNTEKTELGAMSGRGLKEKNLDLIYNLKCNYSIKIIGGGGIYDIKDVDDYKNVGADHFSLSTILLNPFRTKKLINYISEIS